MIVVRSLLGALDLLWLKVYNIFESIPLFLCLVFLKSPSDVLIPVDGYKLELVTHRPVPSALVERWFERRLFRARSGDLQRRCFILTSLTGSVLFFYTSAPANPDPEHFR